MKHVFKYDLPVSGNVDLPIGAQILKIAEQHGKVQLWALVDATAKKERVTLHVYGTGHPIENSERLEFVDTFFLQGGYLVFHVFKERAA